jgi:hypothetical protein
MTEKDDSVEQSTDEAGITDEDMARIGVYLRKPRHTRSVDDLRPSSEK